MARYGADPFLLDAVTVFARQMREDWQKGAAEHKGEAKVAANGNATGGGPPTEAVQAKDKVKVLIPPEGKKKKKRLILGSPPYSHVYIFTLEMTFSFKKCFFTENSFMCFLKMWYTTDRHFHKSTFPKKKSLALIKIF